MTLGERLADRQTALFALPGDYLPEHVCHGPKHCRHRCDRCFSTDLKWVAWGAYLDKDLICQACGRTQDIWDC